MKIGSASQIVIGTKNLDASTIVYDKIGFRRISEGEIPNPYIQYTDDSTIILLNEEGVEYMGFIYFSNNMPQIADELARMGTQFQQRTLDPHGNFYSGIFTTPEGVLIKLVHFDAGSLFQPQKTLAHLSPEEIKDKANYPNSAIGIFGEYSVPVENLNYSLTYWKRIGFESLSVNTEPYPWAIVSDGINIIGLHQTTEFNRQAITYFALDMKNRIEHLKNIGLEDNIKGFTGAGGSDKNVVLTTMENQQFFLFSF